MITDVYGADAGIATVARAVHTNASVAADAADSQGGNNQSVHVRSCPLPSVTVRFAAIYTTARVCGCWLGKVENGNERKPTDFCRAYSP